LPNDVRRGDAKDRAVTAELLVVPVGNSKLEHIDGVVRPRSATNARGTHHADRCVLLQRYVRSDNDLVVVFLVRCENVAKMALANDDDVIKTFSSDRADQPLRISVLPRRSRRDRSVANAHGPDAPDQVAWRLVSAAGLGQLTGKPFRIGICCHTTATRRTAVGAPSVLERVGGQPTTWDQTTRSSGRRNKVREDQLSDANQKGGAPTNVRSILAAWGPDRLRDMREFLLDLPPKYSCRSRSFLQATCPTRRG
jgi:hypothetical protein